jgi:large subunit ribosomal protein L30
MKEEFLWKKYLKDKISYDMAKYRIKQIKSKIGSTQRQKATLEALGFHRMHETLEKEGTPEILGMINKVKHLISLEEIK